MSEKSLKNQTLTRFYIVRHGETEWNTKKIIQGQLDSPLTQTGVDQVKRTANKLKNIKFDLVFSSDLGRAYQSAQVIMAQKDVEIKTTQLLRERHFGKFAGKKVDFFRNQLKKSLAYQAKLNQEEALHYQLHPEIETYEQVARRVIKFIKTNALAYPGKNILVVTHSGTIRALLTKLGLADAHRNTHGLIANAAYLILESDGVEFFVRKTYGIKLVTSKN